MNKCLIIFFTFFINLISSQVNLNVVILKKNSSGQYVLGITVTNESKNNYIIPIDTTGFKAYYPSEVCSKIENTDYPYKYLGPSIIIKDINTDKYLEANPAAFDVNEKMAIEIEKKIDSSLQKKKSIIDIWRSKEKIENYKSAEKNHYLMTNIILLKAKHSFTYEIQMDIFDIRRSEFSLNHDKYILDEDKSYDFSLLICIDRILYNYLTSTQKKKLKNYKFFEGKIISNNISFK
ncbi:hypothetical protein [Chryseobacterium sp. SIMBA_038]|uniref:hypothetical protein n=1 Tax=Chryseobacterium sp. SIMBA_038 TaxID=3085780 RepID=UPI0039790296